MRNEWDEHADGWDTDEGVIRYSEKALQSLGEVGSFAGLSVLDFGCGTGPLAERMARQAKNIVGLDTSPAMLAVLHEKKLPNVATIEGELTAELIAGNPLFRSGLDFIVASSVCGFLPDYDKTLRLLRSLLVPGGFFVQWDWLAESEGADFGFVPERVLGALKSTGFNSVSVTTPFSAEGPKGEMKVLMGVGRNT
jgi:2-polyprenyl-3-methyl-5-hydroxy-6-metoxy-1,4-benzoquinol methylase